MIKSILSHHHFLLIVFILIALQTQSQDQPEKILYNGKIFTANPKQPYADAVGIKGDKIVVVGELTFVKSKLSKEAALIDLQGKCLLPGLIDSHNHAISGGGSLMIANVNDAYLPKTELAAFAKESMANGKGMRGDVLYIAGMHSATWRAPKDLDELFNADPYLDQGVVLRGSDGHTGWLNNAMLKRASINADFIKSLSGNDKKFFGYDEEYEPNGLISEDGFDKVSAVMPPGPGNSLAAGVLGVKHLNALGITAWMDPATGDVNEGTENSELAIYKKLSEQSELTAHVAAAITAEADGDVLAQIKTLRQLQSDYKNVTNVSVIGFKIFADGVLEHPTQTAAISIPYVNSGHKGSLMFDPMKFKNFVTQADKEKLLVHVHAIGDRAVTETLNGYEAARKANKSLNRPHSITHLQLVKPSDFKRFASLNIMANMQLLWATADIYTMDLVKPYIDPSLFASQYPAKSLQNAGAQISGASDWSVSSANPFAAIYTAETRKGKLGVLDAKEIMSREDMLKAYTINSAKTIWMDKSIGSIETGKQADFVLLDRDVTSVSSEEVKNTQVLWTIFGGEIVYKK
jgi:predicted amidohydrolase YtcJ